MSKIRKPAKRGTSKKPAGIYWRVNDLDQWIPTVYLGAKELALEPRPEREFIEGEREAILIQLTSELAERLFHCPRYLFSATGGIAKNPAWDELPVLVDEGDESPAIVDMHGNAIS